MSGSFWRPSDDQRRTILLLEALGLIHDLGKLSDKFLESQAPSSSVEYAHSLLADPRAVRIYQSFTAITGDKAAEHTQEMLDDAAAKAAPFQERPDLTAILEQIKFTDWSGQDYNFAELAPLVAHPGLSRGTANWRSVLGKEMQPGLLVGRLHGPAHIEKEGEPDLHKQPYSDVFRATPFGLEERIATDKRGRELTDALNALPLADTEHITDERRSDWLVKMKAEMSRGPADNRRPHNEISLWDWGYTVAGLTKAAVAQIFKNGWPTALDDLSCRTLRINLNILERYTHSDKISDLLGVRDSLKVSFRSVQKLLEETYALGNRFYHDETGAYYLLPDIFDAAGLAALRREIQAQFSPDLLPQVHLGDRVTVGDLDVKVLEKRHRTPQGGLDRNRVRQELQAAIRRLVAAPRQQALSAAPVEAGKNLYSFADEWAEGRPENAESCTVCGMRPVGYPSTGSQAEAREGLEVWADQEKAEKRNVCRVCLGRRGRRAEQWASDGLTIWTEEVADENGRLALLVGRLGLDGWLGEIPDWSNESLLTTIQVTNDANKNPSPARLYRLAETARAFWHQVRDQVTPTAIGQQPFRLALYPEASNLPNLGYFHAYDLNVNGVALSVVWDKPNRRFLTADNLTDFASRCGLKHTELAEQLDKLTFPILEPSAFQKPSQPLVETYIERVETLAGYCPAIPLLAEPSVCLLLVPASKALALTHAIKREYERQMGRVRDRLPLHLGLIFCPRRTPIRAVLEAGRAMLDLSGDAKLTGWRLMTAPTLLPGECELNFNSGVSWRIPIMTGDGSIEDEWYPRALQGFVQRDAKPNLVKNLSLDPPRGGPNPRWQVWVKPSRFDFEFLSAAGRRFEIYYDERGRRPRRTRPFYLEDLDRLDELWKLMKRLAVSQRHQIIRTIEATREEWYGAEQSSQANDDGVFRQFVADTLAGAAWPKGQSWKGIPQELRDRLIRAGASGELTDLAELHMEILKER